MHRLNDVCSFFMWKYIITYEVKAVVKSFVEANIKKVIMG
ncbi:hypothetical protein S3E15_02191 [Bacillus mycoides]|uniref:Uncharacterized protein n=1 Tax=Bacillus mycoides TaxID=1405 RepID=A0A1C3T720_BACMY|nr:hypothetical protein bcere0014_15730 [Bacillus cereus BDRD-ST196]EEL71560.1 hypothetical protein bcere0026_15730 [Bacillus mycoides]EEM00108.1 hypothetical protein bmyco0001_15560 [Bacillus mycoides DSM 2048]KZD43728.1 hypothetical protein B4083_1128 [Bacillus cereus]KZE05058.1 hypothetical protein B4117_2879 [Bacillus mycoides]